MTIKGYADQQKSNALGSSGASTTHQYATVAPVHRQQNALDVVAHVAAQEVATDAAEADSTTTAVKATAHVAVRGDLIAFTSGDLDKLEVRVLEVEDDWIYTAEVLPSAPANGDTFTVRRQKAVKVSSDGSFSVTLGGQDQNYGTPGAATLRTAAMLGLGSTAVSNANPVPVSDAGGSLTVDGTVTVQDGGSSISVDDNGGSLTVDGTVSTSVSNIAYTAKGKIAGSSLTGSYATLLDPSSDLRMVALFNSCNETILVSLDGGSTDSLELEAGESLTLDLAQNGLKFDNAVNISAKHAGAAPTAGTVRATGIG